MNGYWINGAWLCDCGWASSEHDGSLKSHDQIAREVEEHQQAHIAMHEAVEAPSVPEDDEPDLFGGIAALLTADRPRAQRVWATGPARDYTLEWWFAERAQEAAARRKKTTK